MLQADRASRSFEHPLIFTKQKKPQIKPWTSLPCLPAVQKASSYQASPIALLLTTGPEQLLVIACSSWENLTMRRHGMWAIRSDEHSHRSPKEMFCFFTAFVTFSISRIPSGLLTACRSIPRNSLWNSFSCGLQGKLELLQQHGRYRKI